MAIQHRNIPDAQIHATKGASSASANTVKYADGAGGEGWAKVTTDMINTSSIKNINKVFITTTYIQPGYFAGASTGANTLGVYIPMPVSGTFSKAYITCTQPIGLGSGGYSLNHKFRIGGVDVTNGATGIVSPANGVVTTVTPTSNNTVTAGSTLYFTNSSTTSRLTSTAAESFLYATPFTITVVIDL